jgi:hypothetical protein
MRSVSKGIGKVGLLAPKLSGLFLCPGRGIMPITAARHCGNFTIGHTPHFIQARKARELPWLDGKVSYLGSDQFQLDLEDGQILILRNHEPARLLSHLRLYGEWKVEYQSRYYLLGIQTGPKSTAMFSMGDKPLDSCLEGYVPKSNQ